MGGIHCDREANLTHLKSQSIMEAKEILELLNIPEADAVNIYPYGSRVYGTYNDESDEDFIIVYKSAFLPNGAFRNNAISSKDRKVQAVCYSRSGFQDAINNYEIGALECLSVPDDKVIMKKWPFKIQKWDVKEMGKKIISKASASWHLANLQFKDDEIEMAKKGVYHALRILDFGDQLKEHGKIVSFHEAQVLRKQIMEEEPFKISEWLPLRDQLMSKLR
jgi:hypothetical protein